MAGADDLKEMFKREPNTVEFNITGCRYADFFRQLGSRNSGWCCSVM